MLKLPDEPERHPWTVLFWLFCEFAFVAVESVCAKAIPAASKTVVSNIFFILNNSLFWTCPLGVRDWPARGAGC
jgi:hypothetical protein